MSAIKVLAKIGICCQHTAIVRSRRVVLSYKTKAQIFSKWKLPRPKYSVNHATKSKSMEYKQVAKWLRTLASHRNKKKFRFFEVKIEKASSCRESNPEHLACSTSTLPLSYNNRTTTSPHNSSICAAQVELKCISHKLFIPTRGKSS